MRVYAAIEERTLDRVPLFDWARTRTTSQCGPGLGSGTVHLPEAVAALHAAPASSPPSTNVDVTMFSGLTAANQPLCELGITLGRQSTVSLTGLTRLDLVQPANR